MLLLEALRSTYSERIERAARVAGLPVLHVDSVSNVPPEATLVGVGPSIRDPLDVARDLRRNGGQPLLVFFAANESARDALQAELIRDPFLYPRFELIDLPDTTGQLAARLGRVVARIERQQHSVAVGRRGRPRWRPGMRQQTISAGEHYLASLLAQSTDAIVSTDVELRILTWNQAAEKLFDLPAASALGKTLDVLDACAEDDQHIVDVAQRVLASGQGEESHVICQRGTDVGSSRVDLQACKLEYSIVSPK